MEVPRLHTASPVAHHISVHEGHAPYASTANTPVERARPTGRPRRPRRQAGRELSPSSARWQAWRKEHQGDLEAVLKEHPEAYELFRQAVKSVPETLEEWLQSRVMWRPWVEWREQHRGPLHEVLADPEGWALFCQMRAQKNNPVNMSYEKWLMLPEQQRLIRSVQWAAWRREHPGPQILALMLAAETPEGVEEGWQIYRSLGELKGEILPSTFEEWKALPEVRRKAALSSWAIWRQNHEGRLQDVLGDPEGWKLYSEMLALNPTGGKSRRSRTRLGPEQEEGSMNDESRGGGGRTETQQGDVQNVEKVASSSNGARRRWGKWRSKNKGCLVHILKDPEGWAAYRAANEGRGGYSSELPPTYEEWVQRPEQQLTVATLAWSTWREQHPGRLDDVLADPEGWTLFRNLKTTSLVLANRTAHTADGRLKLKGNRRRERAKRSHRKPTPSTFATAAATPVTTATTTTSAVLAADDGNDDIELKGGKSTADEEQQQQQQASRTAAEENTDALFFPETYEDWLTRRGEKRKRTDAARATEVRGHDERAAKTELERRWQQWRDKHPGPLEEVLAVEPDGWPIYSAYMCRNGQKAFFSDFNHWLEARRARHAWLKWREQHGGVVAVALHNNPEGWPLYRAQSTFLAATRGNSQTEKPSLPETLQEWLQQPAQIIQLTANAWNSWRQAHPGPLVAQLTEEVIGGQGESCGWRLLRVLLQYYVCAASTKSERKRTAEDREPLKELPDTLEELLSDLKHYSKTAWLCWAQQHRRSPQPVRLRDPVGWALYKVMVESDGTTLEFPASYGDWMMQKKSGKSRAVAGQNNNAVSGGTAGTTTVPQNAGEQVSDSTAAKQRSVEVNAVTAWSRWRRQRKGELVTVLQQHTRGWQLYCNMLAAKNRPIPESFAVFKETYEREQQQMQAEAAAQWETWRQQHTGSLEDVLSNPQGAALYRKMVEMKTRNGIIGNHSVKGSTGRETEKACQWILWREQHPGPLEVVFAEHPEAVELHYAWLSAESKENDAGVGKKGKTRGRGGAKGTTQSGKEALRRWREWRLQHPGPLQQVLIADLTAAAERDQIEAAVMGEQRVRETEGDEHTQQQIQQHVHTECHKLTGWQLFCAYATSQGRQVPHNFQEWLQQPQQIAQRDFGTWRATHPGSLVDVLRDPEGWELYVKMKRAAAIAAAEQGLVHPEVIEDYNTWSERERLQREQQMNKRKNRKANEGSRQGGSSEEGFTGQSYQCGDSTTQHRVVASQSEEGCHSVEDSRFGMGL